MNRKLGIEKFRLMLNSAFKPNLNEKEHLHAIISVNYKQNKFNTKDCKIFDYFFDTENGFSEEEIYKTQMDRDSEPYGDNIIDIDNKTCKKLIRTSNFSEFIYDTYGINSEKDFYLFLYFDKKNDKKKGKITGKIAF